MLELCKNSPLKNKNIALKCSACGYKSAQEKTKSFGGKFCPECGERLVEALDHEKEEAKKSLISIEQIFKKVKELAEEPTSKHLGLKITIVVIFVLLLQGLVYLGKMALFPSEEAQEFSEKIESENPELDALLLEAYNQETSGNPKEAEKIYFHILEDYPDNTDAFNSLGFMYSFQGKKAQAKEFYLKTLQVDPFNSLANQNLGVMAKKEAKYNDAIKYFSNVLVEDSENPIVLTLRGETYLKNKNYQLAETDLLKVIDVNPKQKNAYNFLIEIYEKTGENKKQEKWQKKKDSIFSK